MDTRVGRRNGQEILYCKPDGSPCTADGDRELVKDLRERFWIEQAQDEGAGPKSWTQFEFIWSYPFGRQDVGKNRNQPGDGFRYVFRSGLAGSEGRAEWSEVTEVFEGVDPKDIEAFMRTENGLPTYSGFSPHCFLSNLNLGIPRRAAQRRAADKVIEAVDKKVRKSSYINMPKEHGYGTLIVGLPLWFAPPPKEPVEGRKCDRQLRDTGRDGSVAQSKAPAEEGLPVLADRGGVEKYGGEPSGVEIEDGWLQQSGRSPHAGFPRDVEQSAEVAGCLSGGLGHTWGRRGRLAGSDKARGCGSQKEKGETGAASDERG